MHPGESVEEKISLSERFGLWISFYPFSQDDYLAAVDGWLAHFGVKPAAGAREREARTREAIQYSLQRGSRSGRVAWQFAKGHAGAPRWPGARPRRSAAPPRSTSMGRIVRVAAAVILRRDGRVLLAQRPPGKPYEGYWEFPGGKLEPGETPAHALARELHEELGIEVRRAAPWVVQEFVYPHAHVELNFFRVFAFDGTPHGRDGQAFAWQVPGAFDVAPLLPANTRVLRALELPAVYGISCASDLGEDAFVDRAQGALARGLRLLQLREKGWPRDRVRALAQRILPLARASGARVLLNGADEDAREWGLDGVHWTSARLREATSRPDGLIVGASCHDAPGARARGRGGLRLRGPGAGARHAHAPGRADARLGRLRRGPRRHAPAGLRTRGAVRQRSRPRHRPRRARHRDAPRRVVSRAEVQRSFAGGGGSSSSSSSSFSTTGTR